MRLAGAKYHRLPVGVPFHLDAGPQILSVVFRNDFSHGKEDRNLYLDRYELARVGDSPAADARARQDRRHRPADRAHADPAAGDDHPQFAPALAAERRPARRRADAPVRLTILYPAEGAPVYGADAVVARVSGAVGAARPAWVDLIVDGQPQGVRLLGPAAATRHAGISRSSPGSSPPARTGSPCARSTPPARATDSPAQTRQRAGSSAVHARTVRARRVFARPPGLRARAARTRRRADPRRERVAQQPARFQLRDARRAGRPAHGLPEVPAHRRRIPGRPPARWPSGSAATTRCARGSPPGPRTISPPGSTRPRPRRSGTSTSISAAWASRRSPTCSASARTARRCSPISTRKRATPASSTKTTRARSWNCTRSACTAATSRPT